MVSILTSGLAHLADRRHDRPMQSQRLLRRLFAAPARLYGWGLGWLLGHRFLCLTHRGRRSGHRYETVLEVLAWRPRTDEAVVISGFGPRSNWFQNTLAGGAVEIRIGRLRFVPEVRELERTEAVSVLTDYERRNRFASPIIRLLLSRLTGERYDGTTAARERVAEQLPMLAFRPRR
jgi:deazaflavin-dependent oxidoreductase (nitroreductase family)